MLKVIYVIFGYHGNTGMENIKYQYLYFFEKLNFSFNIKNTKYKSSFNFLTKKNINSDKKLYLVDFDELLKINTDNFNIIFFYEIYKYNKIIYDIKIKKIGVIHNFINCFNRDYDSVDRTIKYFENFDIIFSISETFITNISCISKKIKNIICFLPNMVKFDDVYFMTTYLKQPINETISNVILMKKYGFIENNINVLMPASIQYRKGHNLLFENYDVILKSIPNIKFHLCGPIIDKELFSKKPKNINYLGVINEIEQLYKISDYILILSRNEGLPLTIIESFSKKVPVISTKVDGINDILIDKYTMFEVNLHDGIDKIFHYINNISKTELHKIINKAYEIYITKYNKKKIIDAFSVIDVL